MKAQSDMGTTLHLAVGFGHNETAKLLIAKGANINTIDVDGETAIDRAVSEGKKEIVDLLREHGGKTWKELEAEGK